MPMFTRARHRLWLTVICGLAIATAATGLILGLHGAPDQPKIVANNISRNFRACLITSAPDQPDARTAWSGLQSAAHTGHVNAQRIITPRSATSPSALAPYIASLVQRQCGLIISAGPHLDAPLATAAKQHPRQLFLTTGTPLALPNATTLTTPTATSIADAITNAAHKTS